MNPRRRMLSSIALVLALCGCERGCLARWLSERGVGGASQGPAAPPEHEAFGGTDCSDGLLRCVDGRVEASRAAHVPQSCGAGKSGEALRAACACPWDVVGHCGSGCATDGLEVLGSVADAGMAQLCRPEAPVARPVLPGDRVPASICPGRHVTCVDGIVLSCEGTGRITEAIAVCLHGCQWQVSVDSSGADAVDPGAAKNRDGVVSILCKRDHAERR